MNDWKMKLFGVKTTIHSHATYFFFSFSKSQTGKDLLLQNFKSIGKETTLVDFLIFESVTKMLIKMIPVWNKQNEKFSLVHMHLSRYPCLSLNAQGRARVMLYIQSRRILDIFSGNSLNQIFFHLYHKRKEFHKASLLF